MTSEVYSVSSRKIYKTRGNPIFIVTLTLVATLGGFSYRIYGIMSIIAAVFMWKLVPETKGKPHGEIEKLRKKK